MPHTKESHGRYVLGDWGTSRLRLALVENGNIVATCEGPGIGALTASPAATLAALVSQWLPASKSLHVVLSGMVGSRNGLIETAYAPVPIDFTSWSRAAQFTQVHGLHIAIAPGLRDDDRAGAPDVMRGEETQIFGALHLDPTLGEGSHLFVLPGTHSKWVDVEDGLIAHFRTALTGEVFALLRDHSILLKTGTGAAFHASDSDEGFAAGVQRSAHLPERLLGALFEVRTAQLLKERSGSWASGFLSGLLIGDELGGMSATRPAFRDVTIIGDAQLAALYQRAFAERAIEARIIDGSDCAIAGLRQLHECVHGEPP